MAIRDRLRSAADFTRRVMQRGRNYAREDLSHRGLGALQGSWLYILLAMGVIALYLAVTAIFYLIYSVFSMGFWGTLAALRSIPAWMGAKLGGLIEAINSVLPTAPHFVQLILANVAAAATVVKAQLVIMAGKAAAAGTAALAAITPALITASWFLLAVVTIAGAFKLVHLAYQEVQETRLANSHMLDVPPVRRPTLGRSELPTPDAYFHALAVNSLIDRAYADFNNYNYTTREKVVKFLNGIESYRNPHNPQPNGILAIAHELTKFMHQIDNSRGTSYSNNYFLPSASAAVVAPIVVSPAPPAAAGGGAAPTAGGGPIPGGAPPPPAGPTAGSGAPGASPPPASPSNTATLRRR